jgi:hypothetical protein
VLPGIEPYPYNFVVEFHPEGERVRMVVTIDAHPQADVTRVATQTLERQLLQFQAVLAAKRGTVPLG